MDLKICDRCGCTIKKDDTYMCLRGDMISQGKSFRVSPWLNKDLCENCVKEFEKFIEGKKESNDKK